MISVKGLLAEKRALISPLMRIFLKATECVLEIKIDFNWEIDDPTHVATLASCVSLVLINPNKTADL